jgi:hypothetical protein
MRFSVPTVLVAFVACSIVACGGRAGSAGDDDTAGNDSGGTSSGGSAGKSNGGSKTGGSNAGGTSAGGGTSVCDGFADDLGYQLPVMIVNETTSTIHVGAEMGNCGFVPLFQVADASGTLLPELGDCRSSCEQFIRSGPIGGCPAICRFPSVVTLAPGESTIEVWSGLYNETRTLPDECVASDFQNEGSSCSQARQIQPGTFTFQAQAGTALDCSQTTGTSCGACTPDGKGGCVTPGGLISGDILTAETTVELGPSYGVYDSAARPADPDPGSGAGAAPAGMIDSVAIVFRD